MNCTAVCKHVQRSQFPLSQFVHNRVRECSISHSIYVVSPHSLKDLSRWDPRVGKGRKWETSVEKKKKMEEKGKWAQQEGRRTWQREGESRKVWRENGRGGREGRQRPQHLLTNSPPVLLT